MQNIITSTGYGFTGSSAVTNIIEEFENVKSLSDDFECTFLHEVDGIRDLENTLQEGHRLKVDLAIKRFLRLADTLNKQRSYKKYFNGNFLQHTAAYIDSLCTAQWQGNWHRGADTIQYSKEDLLHHNLAKQVFLHEFSYFRYSLFEPNSWHPDYHMRNTSYYAFFDNSFYAKTQKYVRTLLTEVSRHSHTQHIVIDQFFPAYNIAAYLNYAPATKTIIVDRDPRDMYVLNKSAWGEAYIPSHDVNTFINWYKGIRFSQKKEAELGNVLLLHFEDLIFRYEDTLQKIQQFLQFTDEAHIKKQQCFNPAKSIANTRKFKNYPQWKEDIAKIERELADYCYDFPDDMDSFIKIDENQPVELYIKTADCVRCKKKLPQKYTKYLYRFFFGMTQFGEAWCSLPYRKTFKVKLKGLLKCAVFFPLFLVEYCYAAGLYFKIRTHKK